MMRRAAVASRGTISGVAQRRFGHVDSFRASELTMTLSDKKPDLPPLDKLKFGHVYTAHMLKCYWSAEEGWEAPTIEPFANLDMPPGASCLHYAIQCFEGLKAYRRPDGKVYMFRPDKNAERMCRSNERLALPGFHTEEFVEAIKKLVWLDREWIPQEKGFSLYIRPTMISVDPTLGVSAPTRALFYVILSPVGPYFASGFKPVKLFADDVNVRAWKGGVGSYKLGANYGPTIYPQKQSEAHGYSQILWLGPGGSITEVGAMNMMFLWRTPDGQKELATASLSDGCVLPGVTRDSCLNMLRERGDIKVSERSITIDEVVQTIKEGRMIEAFGTGTAAIVCPVGAISYKGVEYDIPVPEDKETGVCLSLLERIQGLQTGEEAGHPWTVPVTGA